MSIPIADRPFSDSGEVFSKDPNYVPLIFKESPPENFVELIRCLVDNFGREVHPMTDSEKEAAIGLAVEIGRSTDRDKAVRSLDVDGLPASEGGVVTLELPPLTEME